MNQKEYYLNILELFHEQGIRYVLLRNYEFLCNDEPSDGLDLTVAQGDMKKLSKVLRESGFCERKQQFSLLHRAFFKLEQGKRVSFDVQVGGIYWNDMKYLGEEVLTRRDRKEKFFTLSPEDTAVMLITHSILGKRFFKAKYQQHITSSLHYDVETPLSRIFSPSLARRIILMSKEGTLDSLNPYPFIAYFIFKKPQRIIIFARLLLRWVVWKKPLMPAPLITIVGPDGAGKSTAVKSLASFLAGRGRSVRVIYTGRGRGHLLPITKVGKAYKKRERKTHHRSSLHLAYLLAAPLFALDLWLRYWLKIFPQRMRRRIVITDRYCSDIITLKHVPVRFKKFLASLFPSPTISIYLYNTAEVLHQRRPEESLSWLEQQLRMYELSKYSLRLKTTNEENDTLRIIDVVESRLLADWW